MSIIVALIIMFSNGPLPSEEIYMAPLHVVAKTNKQTTAWETALEAIKIIRENTPSYDNSPTVEL